MRTPDEQQARFLWPAVGARDMAQTARGFCEARTQAEAWNAPPAVCRRLDHIVSAWKGHEEFAVKLVRFLKPDVMVELGVDYGYSAFAFALPNIGTVYGIDWFQGDDCAGKRDTYAQVRAEIINLGLGNLELIHADFSTAARSWRRQIDILHIDGDHDYASVKRDFELWARFVKGDGVILMHDTISFPDDVGRFYDELQLPKFNFTHSHGLGVVCRNWDLLAQVAAL